MTVTLRTLRRRTKAIQSLSKVTRAMEIISSVKMRRAQTQALASRPYDRKICQVIADLIAAHPPVDGWLHPLMRKSEKANKSAIVHFTSDRGLCGGLNTNVNQLSASFILECIEKGQQVTVIAVGKKGRDFMWKNRQNITAEFTGISDKPTILDITPIARIIIDNFTSELVDEVYLAYPRFVSTMVQRATLERLLPVEPTAFRRIESVEYIFEPDPGYVLGALLPRFIEIEIYHAFLELKASEHSARMVAMRNATNNAKSLVDELTILLNKVRQETITRDILDLIGAMAAQEAVAGR